jgi:hypothetical protein
VGLVAGASEFKYVLTGGVTNKSTTLTHTSSPLATLNSPTDLESGTRNQWCEHSSRPETKREVWRTSYSPKTSNSGTKLNGVSKFRVPNTMLGGAIIPSQRTSKSGTQDHWDKIIKIQIQNVYWSRAMNFVYLYLTPYHPTPAK